MSGVFASLMHSLMSSGAWNVAAPLMQRSIAEVIVRYYKFFVAHTELIPLVLQAFLDTRGALSHSPPLRARAAYLLLRFVRAVKEPIAPHAVTLAHTATTLIASAGQTTALTQDELYAGGMSGCRR